MGSSRRIMVKEVKKEGKGKGTIQEFRRGDVQRRG